MQQPTPVHHNDTPRCLVGLRRWHPSARFGLFPRWGTRTRHTPAPLPLPCRLHEAPHASVDPATGRPFFSPMINKTWAGRRHHHRRRQSGVFSGWFSRHGVTKSTATTTTATTGRGAKRPSDKGKADTDGRFFYHDDDRPIHGSLWERGLALERRREADARSREEARKSAAAAGHVGGRSAELIRAMRVRSLVQTYRTLLASVEYARLPEGLDYDEVESCTYVCASRLIEVLLLCAHDFGTIMWCKGRVVVYRRVRARVNVFPGPRRRHCYCSRLHAVL